MARRDRLAAFVSGVEKSCGFSARPRGRWRQGAWPVCAALIAVPLSGWSQLTPRPPAFEGERYAVVIGISRYQDSRIRPLRFANADARAFADFLLSPRAGLGGYRSENVRLLVDAQATQANIRHALRTFLKASTPNDVVLVYFAGHGGPDPERLDDLYLYAHDTKASDIASTGVPMADVSEATRRVFARDLLVFIDACHSAGVAPGNARAGVEVPNHIHDSFLTKLQSSARSRAILTASGVNQLSVEGEEFGGGHGVFTYYLLRGLGGAADTPPFDGVVTLDEAFRFVEDSVRRTTRNAQIPSLSQSAFDPAYPLSFVPGWGEAPDSPTAVPASVPRATPDPQWGTVEIGSRMSPAPSLFVNDSLVALLARIIDVRVPAGQVRLRLTLEGCQNWDTTFTVVPGERKRVGLRKPLCAINP